MKKEIKDGEKISCRTLTATLDIYANTILIEHKTKRLTSTYYCAMDTGYLDDEHKLTNNELDWLESIETWVTDRENSY